MSSSAGASSTSPSPSSNLCRGTSVHLSGTRVKVGPSRSVPVTRSLSCTGRFSLTAAVWSIDVPVPECEKSSATTYYWYRVALDISDSISEGGGLNWKMTVCLLVAWSIICLAMIKGIQSSGKVRSTQASAATDASYISQTWETWRAEILCQVFWKNLLTLN